MNPKLIEESTLCQRRRRPIAIFAPSSKGTCDTILKQTTCGRIVRFCRYKERKKFGTVPWEARAMFRPKAQVY